MAKTIDNLGPDASSRYAEDKRLYDEKWVKEARIVPQQAEIDVTLPSFPSEFDLLFETTKRRVSWADFYAPPKFNEQKRRLFTQQMIPSLGSSDKKEALMRRVTEIVEKTKARLGHTTEEKRTLSWDEERELQDEEKEKTRILKLLQKVDFFERAYVDINSFRKQYQKG
ncbi:MAG: DUF5399 family protein [Chlamydiales bacterium]